MFLLLLLIEEVNPWISTLHGVKKMSPIRSRAPFSSFPSVAPAIIRVEKKVGSLPKKKRYPPVIMNIAAVKRVRKMQICW